MTQTDSPPDAAQAGPPPPYMVFEIDATLLDDQMRPLHVWQDKQELWLEPPNIAVRRTRTLPDGGTITYEDRGTIDECLRITGTTGFGGDFGGHAFPGEGVIFTEGHGGKASFTMTNWAPTAPNEQRCLRVIDVHEPVAFLTEEPLAPGRYYVFTNDHLRSASPEVPDHMKSAL